MARREFIDEKTEPPSATVVETADHLLRLLEGGHCVDLHEIAAELQVSVKTVRNAIDWLRDSRIAITFMDGKRCWLSRRGYTPEWDQITLGKANQIHRLRARFATQTGRHRQRWCEGSNISLQLGEPVAEARGAQVGLGCEVERGGAASGGQDREQKFTRA